MTEDIQAFPLCWPPGRPRTPPHNVRWSPFKVTGDRVLRDLRVEVARLGGEEMIVSTNLPLRKDGQPYSNRQAISDAGVAVYFTRRKQQMCFACDKWATIAENLWAVVKTIEALRGIERWGSGEMMEQAFTGFTALPAPEAWWQVLKLNGPNVTRDDIQRAWRALISEHHPDTGGDTETAARINRARDQGLEAL